ncbi:MAG: hypothetical protein MMC23_000747 [Stictis urceolatum]|nr:hypothetical protein [Stictis urceolata]
MVSFTSVLLATSLAASTLALPSTSSYPKQSAPFYIKAVKTDSSGLAINGQYLESYHTGAGLADPCFSPDKNTKFIFNGTSLVQDIGNGVQLGMIAYTGDANYARWEPVSIEGGQGSMNWVDNGSKGIGLTGDAGKVFGGWVVCQWYHGQNVPQLFVGVKGFTGSNSPSVPNLPVSCANVKLVSVPA